MQYDENLQARYVPSRQTGFNQCFLISIISQIPLKTTYGQNENPARNVKFTDYNAKLLIVSLCIKHSLDLDRKTEEVDESC